MMPAEMHGALAPNRDGSTAAALKPPDAENPPAGPQASHPHPSQRALACTIVEAPLAQLSFTFLPPPRNDNADAGAPPHCTTKCSIATAPHRGHSRLGAPAQLHTKDTG